MLVLKSLYPTVFVSLNNNKNKILHHAWSFYFYLTYILTFSAAACHHLSESEENTCIIGMLCPILIEIYNSHQIFIKKKKKREGKSLRGLITPQLCNMMCLSSDSRDSFSQKRSDMRKY